LNRNRYRTIFSKRLGMLVPVAESRNANGKGSGAATEGGPDAVPPAPGRLKGGSVLLLAGAALCHGAAWAGQLPAGAVITGGTGTVQQNGSTLTVNQSSQFLSANWQSFTIGANNTVVFNQPGSSSVALNRITGNEASSIYGKLQANGQVFLINPNGILFAPGSQVSVGALAASTLDIGAADVAAGRYRFTHGAGAGSVVNEGRIDAGSVAFIAPRISNNGTISTPGGSTTLAAGDQVTLSMLGGLLSARVDVSAAGAEILNHGRILADGGRVDLTAGRADAVLTSLINTDGVIQARGLRQDGGRIFLDGGAGGAVKVSGTLDASAPGAERGGEVHVLGDRITLADGARLDASGRSAGGTVLVGGDYQGKNAAILNAAATTVEAGATIRADGAGQGGRVIVWSDGATRFAGDIQASGKGFAEVSGKGRLDFSGTVNTGGGTLLLDPTDIVVQSAAGNGTSTFSPAQIATLLASNDVVLSADHDITWGNPGTLTLNYNGVGSRSLTLQAGNNITFRGVIQDSVAGGDRLNVTLNADRDADGVGAISFVSGSKIVTSGGDIVLRGGNAPLTALPAFTDPGYAAALSATAAHNLALGLGMLDAGGGNITLRGEGTAGSVVGILMLNSVIRTAGTGAITIDGLGSAGSTNGNYGVQLFNATPSVTTVDGTVSVQGTGRGTGTGSAGVHLGTGTLQATGSGNLIVNGLGAAGGDASDGVVAPGAKLSVFNGNLAVTGTASGTGAGSDGIELSSGGTGAVVEATGSGNVSLNGTTTATGANTNRGVAVTSGATVRTTSGTLTLQGSSAAPAAGAAISLESGGVIGGASQGGAVTLTGDTVNLASGQLLGTGALLLQPLTPATTIGLGDGAAGTFNLASGAIGLIQNGYASLTLGRADGSGAVDVRTVAFTDPVTIRTPSGGGSIAVNGTLSTGAGAGLGSITLQAGGAVSLNNGTITTGDALTLTGSAYTATGSSALNSNTLTFGNTNGITNTGTLTLNQTAGATIANAIGGPGSLVKAGAGATTLAGANTYAGATAVTGGVLRIGADRNLGTAPGSATPAQLTLDGGTLETTASFALDANRGIALGAAGGAVDVDAGTTLTYGGIAAGTGTFAKAGAGTLALTGSNTYSGPTTVNAGTLQIGSGGASGALGTGTVVIAGGAGLVFDRSDAATIANTIVGAGDLTQAGPGTTILAGDNSYGGSTTVGAGTLQIGGGAASGTLGTGAVTVAGGASLVFNRSDAATIANTIGGAGSLTQAGAGTTILTGANSYGATTVGAGTLQIGSGGTSGTLGTGAVTIADGAGLVFNRSDTATAANSIGGAGSLTQAGPGATILAGANSYSGATTVGAGTLQIGAGGASGTLGTGAVTNNATLVFNRSDALTVANTIGGPGSLVQAGAGATTLAGANTYAGATTVTGGVLRIGADRNLGTAPATATPARLTLDGGALETTASFTLDANRGIALGAAGGTLNADAGTTLTYGGIAAGAGAFAKAGTGTLVLTGNNTYGGATTVTGGTLQVGNNGTTGTLGAGAVTDDANLVFSRSDSTSLSTLAAGGIAGTGKVSALVGGNLDVNRPIALTGANSAILLEAGQAQPAGTAAGGDVTLTSNIATSATGTVTIFSGTATTAAYEAKISGATGPTRYKTYNASAADTSGAVAGTRNYDYRQGSGTLSVSGLTATKTYDGLIDAAGTLSGGAVNASGDGDMPAYSDLTQVSATFDSAHAGSRSIAASFIVPTSLHYSAAGATWSVSRFSSASITGSGNGTITPRQITTGIQGVGKTYDGLTATMATLGAPAGFIGGDSANGVTGILLAFDNPNAGTHNIVASGAGQLTDFKGVASGNGSGVGAHNEVAGLASDYVVALPAPASAVIAAAPLTVRANNDAKIVTQDDTPLYNDVRFDGFMNGESAANLGGSLSITRSNADTNAVGRYSGVLVPSGYTSSNYAITYANGDFRILPAQELLVRIQNVRSNYGTAPDYVVKSAQYLDANGTTIHTLTRTAQSGNTYTYSDGTGGSVTFTVTPQGAILSGAGKLAAGNYALAGDGVDILGNNFTGSYYVGNQTVNRAPLTPSGGGVTKVYDGTTAAAGITLGFDGLLTGDVISADGSGTFSSRNAGTNLSYSIQGITLGGADAGNYYLASASLSGNNGTIVPRRIIVTAVPETKVFDGTPNASGTPAVTGSLAAGDNFTKLIQAYSTSNIGMRLTLTPLAQIDDGNGGANYALTLTNNTVSVISAGADINQLGVTHAASILNHDNAEGQPDDATDTVLRCGEGAYRDACGKGGEGVYKIVARGLKLPPGLVLPP